MHGFPRAAMNDPALQLQMHCHVVRDAALYLSDLESSWPTDKSLLLLIPTRLGTDALNPVYISILRSLFKRKDFLGIAG